jgi:3-oxoacyl-[acyl-carrier protein] reductase/meso-butanediol dehydrogenase/(S,S)-butanediol dehydrogenase/diacetyl reductase
MEKSIGTAVITGGNKGIGETLTRAFCERGYRVIVGARSEGKKLADLGKTAVFRQMDVADETGHVMLTRTALDLTGRLDVYINCAGLSLWRPVAEIDESFWQTMIDTNLTGTFWGCKAAARTLKKGGCIINISSLAGKRGSANNSAYCAAKFGVNGITQSLAKELGSRGIRVNAVCPVYIKTAGLMAALRDKRSPAGTQEVNAYIKGFAKGNAALGRMPEAAEVASTCLFLASPAASAITGQCINVDCGVLPQ